MGSPSRPFDAAAARLAEADQSTAAARDTARSIVAFHAELDAGHVPSAVVEDLTREYGLGLLIPPHHDEDD